MKRYIKENEDIFCMSNIRGAYVKNPHKLPFSFYFSAKGNSKHSIRVKPVFNDSKLYLSKTGTLKLSDDWKFVPGKDDKNVSSQKIHEMKTFFKTYIVLFCAVWDEQLQDGILADYFNGSITFHEMLEDLEFYLQYQNELDGINDVVELESFCRDNNLVNLYGN